MSESNFYFKDSFMTAMKKVIDGKPLCTGCSTRFFSHKDLEKHLKYCDAQKKTGSELLPADRPSCDICGLVFISEYDLSNHKYAHKETPYECELCDKKFQRKISFDKHQKVHSGKDHCDICNIHFSTPKDLIAHKREQHRNVEDYMRYICQYCNKHYMDSDNLKQHVQQVHKEEEMNQHQETSCHNLGVFMCGLCNRRYSTYQNLEEHISYNHPQNIKTEVKKEVRQGSVLKIEPESVNETTDFLNTSDDQIGLKIDEECDGGSARDTPPQLSPVSPVSENRVTPLPPPALEAVPQRHSQINTKPLATQRFAKGHESPKMKFVQRHQQGSKISPNLKPNMPSTVPSPTKLIQETAAKTVVPKQLEERKDLQIRKSNSSPGIMTAHRQQKQIQIIPKSKPVVYSSSRAASGTSNVQSSETSRPSAVWLRHLEKMKSVVVKQKQYAGDAKLISDIKNRNTKNKKSANQEQPGIQAGENGKELMAKQKQYEQELHLQKLYARDIKLISDIKNRKNKISTDQEPVVKRFKMEENQSSATNGKQPTQLQTVHGARVTSGKSSSQPNSNGTLSKTARRPPPVSAKMSLKLQREKERREKFLKKHEDLLNQELVEGEIPAVVLNDELVDESNKNESNLEIEVKLDDGSTAVIDLPTDS